MEITLEQALQKGVEAHKAGNFPEADRYYTFILKANPKHPDANHNMGVLAVGVGKVDAALPFFKTALVVNPNIAQFWLSYIDALIKTNQMDEARAVFEQAKRHRIREGGFDKIGERIAELEKDIPVSNAATTLEEPQTEQLQNLVKLYTQGQFQGVLTQGSNLLKQFPNSINLYNIIGAANKGLSKLDEAIESYKKALSINPDYAEIYNNLGNALKDQGKLDEAIEEFNKAIRLNPDYAEAYSNMGNALRDQGKLDEAITACNASLFIKPDYAEALNNLGNALNDQGKLDEAIDAYNKALSIKSDYAEVYNNLGNALKDQGKLQAAIEAYKKALLIRPDYQKAKYMLSALTGNTPKTAPREYVENLFDRHSKKFESLLVDKLEYTIPKLIRNMLIKSDSKKSLGSVLDLGCGTGLLGPEIRNQCSKLEGIDLSSEMLKLAKQKNVYDKLSHSDIGKYLSSMPLDFDFYISLDVFIYVGELTEIFRLIKSRNKKPGHLVFSTEHAELDGYHILRSGRYSHSKSYIESLCKKFDYNITHFSTTKLRKDNGSFLTGGIYTLEFENKI